MTDGATQQLRDKDRPSARIWSGLVACLVVSAAALPAAGALVVERASDVDTLGLSSAPRLRVTARSAEVVRVLTLERPRFAWGVLDSSFVMQETGASGRLTGEVLRIEQQSGVRRGLGTALGAVAGAGIGALAVARHAEGRGAEWSDPWILSPYLYSSVGGAFLGAIVGSTAGRAWKKYTPCYESQK